jgi:hypothetical protein
VPYLYARDELAVVVNYAGSIARTCLFMLIQAAVLSEYTSNHCMLREGGRHD